MAGLVPAIFRAFMGCAPERPGMAGHDVWRPAVTGWG